WIQSPFLRRTPLQLLPVVGELAMVALPPPAHAVAPRGTSCWARFLDARVDEVESRGAAAGVFLYRFDPIKLLERLNGAINVGLVSQARPTVLVDRPRCEPVVQPTLLHFFPPDDGPASGRSENSQRRSASCGPPGSHTRQRRGEQPPS